MISVVTWDTCVTHPYMQTKHTHNKIKNSKTKREFDIYSQCSKRWSLQLHQSRCNIDVTNMSSYVPSHILRFFTSYMYRCVCMCMCVFLPPKLRVFFFISFCTNIQWMEKNNFLEVTVGRIFDLSSVFSAYGCGVHAHVYGRSQVCGGQGWVWVPSSIAVHLVDWGRSLHWL